MAYLLDTNAVIALMKNHSRVVEHIRHVGRFELAICAPVEAELWFGVNKSNRLEENRHQLLTVMVAQSAFFRGSDSVMRRHTRRPCAKRHTHRPLRFADRGDRTDQ